MRSLVGERDAFGRTALHLAAWEGHAAVVADLCRAGAEVNAGAQDSLTALHFAASKDRTEAARRLLNAGAAVNARSRKGATPLLLACRQGAVETAKLLLGRKADPMHSDHAGRTPLESLPEITNGDSKEAEEKRLSLTSLRGALETATEESRALRDRLGQGAKSGSKRQRKRLAEDEMGSLGEQPSKGGIGPAEKPAAIGPPKRPVAASPPASEPIGPVLPPEGHKRRKVIMSHLQQDSSSDSES